MTVRIMFKAMLVALCLAGACLSGLAWADNGPPQFDDPALAQRYDTLTNELRCPKCENETLASSGAVVAADIRQRIAGWLQQGESDQQIRDKLVARFGEYVLYKPRIESRTWLLWGLPGLAVLLGLCILALLVLRYRRHQVSELDESEQARLASLLKRHASEGKNHTDGGPTV